MAAQHNLSGNQFFHVAPADVRESIGEHGLDTSKGEKAWDMDYPKGNYLFGDESAAHGYRDVLTRQAQDEGGPERSFDVWNVNLPKGVKTQQDPFHDDESGLGESSVYTKQPIPPTALRRKGA